ncbi:TPA: hypothetical protein ACGCBI_003178 [Serratia marcescens]|nr:hypothetical protein [Serratia marcescens]BBO63066.1 hypothetical protein SMATCC274_23290 [Serratia marcescens]HAU97253.1 hypothetical protein [Serratia marcescens]HEJ6972507.1 hypothetical protein [Serratia marcescens]HEJ6978516.1 hypothetical protein [Serratia marcescens]HEJ7136997.1 hypothetical protein [Serratia marcescens]
MTEELASTIISLYDEHAAAWERLRPTTLEEYTRLLQENGFRVVDHVVEDPACGGRTVWLAQSIK